MRTSSRPITTFALAAALGAAGLASPAGAGVDIQDLVELTSPSEVTISRDGKQVAWIATTRDLNENKSQSRLYLWRQSGFESLDQLKRFITGGKKQKRYRAMTSADEDAETPSFDRSGKSLAFMAARGEDAETQVWVLPLDGGEAEARTDAPEGVDSYAWLPDGSIVYLASAAHPAGVKQWHKDRKKSGYDARVFGADRRPKGFWRVSPEGETTRIFLGGPGIENFALSWTGTHLVYRDNGTGDPSHWDLINLYVLDLATGETRQLTDTWGDEWDPAWSHDNQTIYCLVSSDPQKFYSQPRIAAIPFEGGEAKELFVELDRDITTFVSVEGDRRLFALVPDGTRQILCKMFPNTEVVKRIVDQPGRVASLSVDKSGDRVAFMKEGPGQAPEVGRWEYDNKDFEWLTWENRSVSESADAVHETIRWTAPDGLEIEGILVTAPEAARPLPTIVIAHGGPWSSLDDTMRWAQTDAIVGRGYAVFAPNVRGSLGYTADFNVANYQDLGGADFQDLMSGVDHLIAQGIADPARLGITGGSYGGFLTNVAITSTDRFAAAVSEFGIASFITDFAISEYRAFEPGYLGGYFWENPELYSRLSPLTHVANVVTPTLIQHGSRDTNTPTANSQALHGALLEVAAAPVELAMYPREGHGFREPSHRVEAFERKMAWFDQYVLGRDPALLGRVGTPIANADWSLLVREAKEQDSIGDSSPEAGRWLTVDFVLSAQAKVEQRDLPLTGPNAPFRLVDADGLELRPVGVPTSWNGATHLVLGETTTRIQGDPGEDNASWSFRVVFDLAKASPPGQFHALELPPVEVRWTTPEPEPEPEPRRNSGRRSGRRR